MRCQEARTLIYTYLDGCLAGQVERAFFGHLSQCENCRQELEYARQTHTLLEQCCTPVEPPADFTERVMAALDTVPFREQEASEPEGAGSRLRGDVIKSKSRWNFGRLAQVASFVVLSAAVWLGTMLNGGLQLARTPDLGINPGTGYQQPEEQETNLEPQDYQVAVNTGSKQQDAGEAVDEDSASQSETVNVGETTALPETNPQVPEAEGAVDEIKNPPVEENGGLPEGEHQVMPVEIPVPEQEIVEPGGVFMAAGADGPETLSSISLQRVAFSAETRHLNGIFAGGKVRYLEGTPGNRLTILDAGLDGGEPEILGETGKPVAAEPIWSADGKRLAYLHRNEEGLSLYIDDLSGGAVEVAPAVKSGSINYPVWSRKGELAYLLADESSYYIVVSNGQDSPVVATTDYPGGLAWSADGTAIAYGKNGYLYTVNRDGTGEKAVVQLPGQLQSIAWSSGNNIAVNVQGTDDRQEVWLGKADGSDWQKVAEIGGGREIAWSPDGKKIAFTDAPGKAYLLTFTAEGLRDQLYVITPEEGNGGARNLNWASDSEQLLLEWAPAGETTGIWKAILP